MKTGLLITSFAVLCLSAGPAMAATFGDGGVALQGVLDGMTTAPVAGSSSVNVLNDEITDGADKYWHITGSGGSVSTIIVEIAGYAGTNVFGVYDIANPASRVQLFAGAADAADQAVLSVKADGSVWVNLVDTGVDFGSTWFGWYLDASAGANGGLWYSDTGLNADQMDHMYAYEGKGDTVKIDDEIPGPSGGDLPPAPWTSNEYVLAWEDLDNRIGSDRDYTDMVLMVESVYVPVPGAILLGVIGLGAVGVGLRRFA
jgi:hypothetical protein